MTRTPAPESPEEEAMTVLLHLPLVRKEDSAARQETGWREKKTESAHGQPTNLLSAQSKCLLFFGRIRAAHDGREAQEDCELLHIPKLVDWRRDDARKKAHGREGKEERREALGGALGWAGGHTRGAGRQIERNNPSFDGIRDNSMEKAARKSLQSIAHRFRVPRAQNLRAAGKKVPKVESRA